MPFQTQFWINVPSSVATKEQVISGMLWGLNNSVDLPLWIILAFLQRIVYICECYKPSNKIILRYSIVFFKMSFIQYDHTTSTSTDIGSECLLWHLLSIPEQSSLLVTETEIKFFIIVLPQILYRIHSFKKN